MSGPIFWPGKSAKELIITGIYTPTVVATNEPPLVLIAVDMASLPVTSGSLSRSFGSDLSAGRTGEQLEQTHTETESPEATVTTTADADVDQTMVMQTVAAPKSGMKRTKCTRSEPVAGDLTSLDGRIETGIRGGFGIDGSANR